jgi:hypothetical protein
MELEKMRSELTTVGSLSHMSKQSGESLTNVFFTGVDVICILDSSGSMGATDGHNFKSRLDVAISELERIQADYPGNVALIEFADEVCFQPNGVPLQRVGGGTNMAAALEFVLPADGCDFQFILISDGQPDSEHSTLKVAAKFTDPIHTVYCGPEDDRNGGQAFLRRLAQATGGKYSYEGIGKLAKPVTRLLTSKSETIHL